MLSPADLNEWQKINLLGAAPSQFHFIWSQYYKSNSALKKPLISLKFIDGAIPQLRSLQYAVVLSKLNREIPD